MLLLAVATAGMVWLGRMPPGHGAEAGAPRAVDDGRALPATGAGSAAADGPVLPRPTDASSSAGALPDAGASAASEVEALPAGVAGPSGVVHGRVLDQDDAPVADVTVSLHRGQQTRQATTGAAGRFRFDELPAGHYRLYVEPHGLPDGLLPPWRQQVARDREDDPHGVYGTALRLTAGAEQSADLRVFAAASVQGRVVGADGAPMTGAIVTLRSPSGVEESARSEEDGRFRLDRVRPGAYTASVAAPARRSRDEAHTDGQDVDLGGEAPLPVRLDVPAGRRVDLGDLVWGRGGHVLTGIVLDQHGLPVAGLRLRGVAAEPGPGAGAVLAGAVTGADGRFRLGRVPSGALLVDVEPVVWAPGAPLAPLAAAPAPLPVETRGAPAELDVGVLRVEARRPFRLLGRVRVDPDWARAHDLLDWRARVLISLPEGPDGAPPGPPPADSEPRVGAGGTFTWACATPHPEIELTVVVRGRSGSEVERSERVTPAPGETRELVVSIP